MRILVIMKRFGANKDMVEDNFGRQIRLFENLKKHKIDFLCLDYKKHENKNIKKNGISYYVRPYSISRHFRFIKELKKLIRKNKYKLIVGTTDPLIGILGYFYSKKFEIKYIYDIQDEYSCYDSYKIPFVKYLDKITIKNSDIVIAVSRSLKQHIKKSRKKPTYTIQNGFDSKSFKKISKDKARKTLKLPKGKIIIYIGEISKFKGADTLIEAFKEVKKSIPNCHLLLSGAVSREIKIKQDSIIYKRYPKRVEIITALNASDLAVLPNKKNKFSEYCFPYKLMEYMAIGLPIVATKVGDASKILSGFNESICIPSDKKDMENKIIKKLKSGKKEDYSSILKTYTWSYLAKKIDNIIKRKI